jgi:flagellar hook-associated protein FlgK
MDIALQNALTGLQAAQTNLSIISSNISNAQTPGYSRESVPMQPQILGGVGAGVSVGLTQRQVDDSLSRSVRNQDTTASAATTTDNYLQQVQSLFGQVNDGNSLGDVFGKFSSALQTLSTTPDDPIAQQNAVAVGQNMAQKLNEMSSGIQQVRTGIDGDIAASVQSLNASLKNIAGFNAAITQAKSTGQPTAALEDQRDQALDDVAKLMGVQDFVRPDGTMVVLTNTGKVLVDSSAQQLSYLPAGTVNAKTPMSPLTVNGIDITAESTTGKIGALLSLRDKQLPNVTAELNQFTNNLFNATQAANLGTTNSGLGATNDAKHFFAGVDTTNGVDNASTIQVHPDLLGNSSLLDGTAVNPDPSISQALASGVSATMNFAAVGNFTSATTTTLGDYASQILGQTANASAAATDNAKFQTNLQTSFASRASSVSGVNIDQELASLAVFQNMYAASAHVMTAVQNMLNALMQIQ